MGYEVAENSYKTEAIGRGENGKKGFEVVGFCPAMFGSVKIFLS